MKQRLPHWIFIILLSIFYGVMAAGQILGLAKLYYPWLVIPFSLIISMGIISLYKRYGDKFLFDKEIVCPTPGNRWLETAFFISGLGVFFLLVFYPLMRWPYSPISTTLAWDAGLYHFPKAIEMIVTHSGWDFNHCIWGISFWIRNADCRGISSQPVWILGRIGACFD